VNVRTCFETINDYIINGYMHEELGGTYLGNKGKVSKMGCHFQFRPMDM